MKASTECNLQRVFIKPVHVVEIHLVLRNVQRPHELQAREPPRCSQRSILQSSFINVIHSRVCGFLLIKKQNLHLLLHKRQPFLLTD
jgi:hypothetical protein